MEISKPYPFYPNLWSADEKDIFEQMPADYRAFLQRNNGGFVDSDQAQFVTPIERVFNDKRYPTSDNALEELWAFLSYQNEAPVLGKPASILHEHLDRHEEEEFLPNGVIVIGRCMQSCLICLSLNPHDYGVIYYWEWYWRYPWYEAFFAKRIDEASLRFNNVDAILDDDSHPQYQDATDALNYATLVKVADSFADFMSNLSSDLS